MSSTLGIELGPVYVIKDFVFLGRDLQTEAVLDTFKSIQGEYK